MAKANSTPIDRPIDRLKVERLSWGITYKGTQADLIGAGLVRLEWFPGPGTSKTETRIAPINGEMRVLPFGKMATREQEENGLIRIRKPNKREFEVYIRFTQAELDKQNLREEIERKHAEKKKSLDALPKSSEQFSAKRFHTVKGMLELIFNTCFSRADGGYHYSREVTEKARRLATDLIELAEGGKVYFDKARYQYAMEDIEERHVKANPEFSAFMASTLAIGKVALDE
jgi:hypothetical protein